MPENVRELSCVLGRQFSKNILGECESHGDRAKKDDVALET